MRYDDENEPGYDPGPCYTRCLGCGCSMPAEDLDEGGYCSSPACLDDGADSAADWHDHDGSYMDDPGFADPGGKSALRASGPGNPRNLPCPNCGAPNRLTPADRARGYQCDPCADRAERGGDY